jgi:hypothetical protein
MIKVLVLEHSVSGRKCNFFLNEEQWEKFNLHPDPSARIFNIQYVIKLPKSIEDQLSMLTLLNILELP